MASEILPIPAAVSSGRALFAGGCCGRIPAVYAARSGGDGGVGGVGIGAHFELTFGMARCSFDTMIPEERLTGAEQKVLTAFQAGDTVVNVANEEIRGSFLRGLFCGDYHEKADYRGTRIVGAIISDEFNMEFCETKFPVRFFNCHFERKIKIQQLVCPELYLRDCTLKNGLDAPYAKVVGGVFLSPDSLDGKNLRGFRADGGICLACSDIGGQLICIGKVFKNGGKFAFTAQGVKVAKDLALSGEFKGEVCLAGAEIGGQLVCTGGRFQNERENALVAHNIKVAGDVRLGDGFYAEGMVTLLGATVEGQLNCAGGNFRNKNGNALVAQGIRVTGDVFLSIGDSARKNGKFHAEGVVSLAYANIGGQLNCAGGIFQNEGKDAIDAQGIKVAGDVLLQYGFEADGRVSFLGADIGGQLVCAGGGFQNKKGNALIAQNIKVASDVILRDGFNAMGAVWLVGAEIGGQLDCTGGSFQNQDGVALNAQGIKVASEVFLIPHVNERKFSANGLVSFTNATIGGSFLLKGCKLARLSLNGANVLGEFQDDADAYKLDRGDDIDLNIDGFRYQRLDTTKERVKDRLAWVGSMSKGDDFYPQPYEQLMKVYREMGHMNWARRVGFELEKKRHKQLRLNRDHKRFVVLGWAWWFWYWILRGTIGYGYKPFRAVTRWFAPLIVASLVLFSGILPCSDPGRAESEACHCMAPSDAEVLLSDDWKIHGKLPNDYPGFNPFYYAVETALPVLPLGQTENWHPKTWWVRWLQGAITIIGALVLTILASYGVGVLGPRWKDE